MRREQNDPKGRKRTLEVKGGVPPTEGCTRAISLAVAWQTAIFSAGDMKGGKKAQSRRSADTPESLTGNLYPEVMSSEV